uniref:Uncharacterized protein n=2 Tax=Strongyloides stercoralis TaxID=6248 RepID=A0A0K0EIN3_STRER
MNDQINIPYFGDMKLKIGNKSETIVGNSLNITYHSTKKPYVIKEVTNQFFTPNNLPVNNDNTVILSTTPAYDNDIFNVKSKLEADNFNKSDNFNEQNEAKTLSIPKILFFTSFLIVTVVFFCLLYHIFKKSKNKNEGKKEGQKDKKKIKDSNEGGKKKMENVNDNVKNSSKNKNLINEMTKKNKFKSIRKEEVPKNSFKSTENKFLPLKNCQFKSLEEKDILKTMETSTLERSIQENLKQVHCNGKCVKKSKPNIYTNFSSNIWISNEEDLSMFSFQISSNSNGLE